MSVKLYTGDCLDIMPTIEENSVDTVITDPPAGISFMGKSWDSDRGGRDEWIAWLTSVLTECYRVLKPGGALLIWSIPRTSHWTGTAVEDAGFRIVDVIQYVFGTGFPKSHNISKAIDKAAGAEREVIAKENKKAFGYEDRPWKHQPNADINTITAPATPEAQLWDGWGTSLKPAAEFWWLAYKPREGTYANNALKWGVSGLNIDGGRAETNDTLVHGGRLRTNSGDDRTGKALGMFQDDTPNTYQQHSQGRWPAHLVTDGSDEVTALFPNGTARFFQACPQDKPARLYYGSKASRRERNAGLEGIEGHKQGNRPGSPDETGKFPDHDHRATGGNNHPTVKALSLMRYLCKLTRTPTGGIVLDPFMGSGSTGCAAVLEGRDFIGIEKNADYMEIARKRIAYWENEHKNELPLFNELQSPEIDT